MATANPAANVAIYRRVGYADSATNVMTLNGTVMKTLSLLAILLVTAGISWPEVFALKAATDAGQAVVSTKLAAYLGIGLIGGLITCMITIFAPRASPITGPLYAALEGLLLGAGSAFFEIRYPGIVTQAVGLTLGVLAVTLFVYGTRLIRATEKFRIGVAAATGAIFLVYLVNFVAHLFGTGIPYIHESGMIGIGFSLFVVVIAALNLILDFDFIEKGVEFGAPKYMEWYGGFSLMVTLIWLYLEVLRLLAKLNDRRN